jgi:hypothetical protein
MDYIPLVLGLGAVAGLITYVEVTLRREKLSGLHARQSIIDRRLIAVKSSLERIEHRLDAMTVDREVAATTPCSVVVNGPVDKAVIAKLLSDELAVMFGREHRVSAASPLSRPATSPSRRPCLDCASVDAHTPDCALSMDALIESPTDAAARRGRD